MRWCGRTHHKRYLAPVRTASREHAARSAVFGGDFVWALQISGAAPAAHFTGGYAGASSERQPAMYFRLDGGTLKGVSRPGEVDWSRIYVEGNALKADLGRPW